MSLLIPRPEIPENRVMRARAGSMEGTSGEVMARSSAKAYEVMLWKGERKWRRGS